MTENNELENTQENIEIPEPEIIPNPWDNAPKNVYFYDSISPNGKLGSYSLSAKFAYISGWDIEHNFISITDTQISDIDDWPYLKSKCPHKTQEMIDRENTIQEIQQLKKALSDTDYKAIKYAEGQISEEDYAGIRAERQACRDRINWLEERL